MSFFLLPDGISRLAIPGGGRLLLPGEPSSFAYSAFQCDAFQNDAFQINCDGESAATEISPNGNRYREYRPTYHELRERHRLENQYEEAQLDLKSTEIKIESLEFKRLNNLADRAMQLELLQLLAKQHELAQLVESLQQQKLRALNDDDDFLALLMAYPI